MRNLAPTEVAGALYKATFDAYQNIIDLCIRERVDALLVAGDIFDGADRSLRAQLKLVDGLNRLESAGIRSFICHGNHDPLSGWEAQLVLPSGCYRFGEEVGGSAVFSDEPERVIVYGISYPQGEVRENLAPRFNEVEPGRFTIGLLHANVDNNPEHDSYAPCTINDLMRPPIDYWALGHVHTRQVLHQDRPTVVYPGNPQGRHPNEPGARGVYLVDVTDSGDTHLQFRPVDVVRWETVEINIGGMEIEQHLFDAIDQKVVSCSEVADGRSVVFRLVLTGRGSLHRSLMRPNVIPDILEKINDISTHAHPWLWCERVQIATASLLDREQVLQREDFVGDLARLCGEFREDPEALSELRQALSELYTHPSARQYLRDYLPSDSDLRGLVAAAEEECLTALVEEADGP
jgi:DNA repair exonuclease SbcCD nuclease subunit